MRSILGREGCALIEEKETRAAQHTARDNHMERRDEVVCSRDSVL
jgi:hypothetical protein